MPTLQPTPGKLLPAAIAVSTLLAAGCASIHERQAAPTMATPPLELLAAGALELPNDCAVADGVAYRTNYVVQRDGRVAEILPESAPACLQSALVRWVTTFRYAPPHDAVAAAIDWMQVSATRIEARGTAGSRNL